VALITELDDRTLVEQHRAGDEDAFRRIVERHHRSLYANALRRLGDPVLAEDAVQEAFLRAFRNLDRFDGAYHLDAWLHRIVTNTCHDIGRRQGRDTRLFDRACTTVEVEAPAADEGLDLSPRDQLTDALDQLPESYREVLLLRFVDEMSYEDVALKAGISEENARARVSRGRTMLKRMMSSTSALLVWAIPPLRRSQAQLTGSEADVANQAAGQVQAITGLTNIASTAAPSVQTASGFSHLSSLAAQAGPTIAQTLPTVTTSGSTLGKAAVAVGIAASMAIPTGVAVDRARNKPAPPAAAPVLDEAEDPAPSAVTASPDTTVAAPSSSVPDTSVEALASGGPEVLSGTSNDATSTTEASTPTTVAEQPSTTTPSAPVPDGTSTPTEPAEEQPVEETSPPAAPTPGKLTAEGLAVAEAGDRIELSGPIALAVGEYSFTGQVTGKLLIADAGAKSQGERQVQVSELKLHFDDGTVATLLVSGTAVVTNDAGSTVYGLTLVYDLERAADFGLDDEGQLTGRLEVKKDQGSLTLDIPGAPADDATAAS